MHSLRTSSRGLTCAALFAILAFVTLLAGCGDGGVDEEEFPDGALRWIVPTAAGGGFDRTTRTLQPHLEDALGVPLEVTYRAGGNFAIGATTLLREGAACRTVMIHGTPLLHFSHLAQNVGTPGRTSFRSRTSPSIPA
jgi:putative tricarboxylic transport membrane protein